MLALLASGCGLVAGTGESGCQRAAFSTEQSGSDIGLRKPITSPSWIADRAAQSFQVAADTTTSQVAVKLKANATFSQFDEHFITLTIYTNIAGKPGTAAHSGSSLRVRDIRSGTSAYYTFVFGSPVTLTAGTHWIVVSVDYAANNSNYISWIGNDTSSTGYPAGEALYLNSGNWESIYIGGQRDLNFVVGC